MRIPHRFYFLLAILLLLSLSCSINLDFQDPTPVPPAPAEPQPEPAAEEQPEQPQSATPAATHTPIPPTSELPRFITQSIYEESITPKYTIDFEYPNLENTAAQSTVNTYIQNFSDSNITTFKNDVDENEAWRQDNFPDFGNDLHVRYITTHQDNTLASFRFSISTYIAGAAHPNTMIHTVTFDLANNQVLAFDQLFNPGSNYLEIIASYCKDELQKQELLAWEEGADPIPENYPNWNLTANGLLITFNPYQVAPYAAGIPEVIVPYDVLQPAANPSGPLGQFTQ
jgi:hypothetical protein